MRRSIPNPETTIAAPSESQIFRRGLAHFEPFNGSDAMLSIRESVDEKKAQAIFTVRDVSDSMLSRTIALASP